MAINVIKQKRTELKTFFQEWIVAVLPGMNIYFMDQAAPRPALPYVGFRPISSIDTVGFDERRYDDEGNETLRGQRVITCDLIACSDAESRHDGEDDAWSILQELRFSLCYDSTIDSLCGIACRVIDEGTVQDISETTNTSHEARAQLSITLSAVIVQSTDSGAIEEINASGTVTSPAGAEQEISVNVTKP